MSPSALSSAASIGATPASWGQESVEEKGKRLQQLAEALQQADVWAETTDRPTVIVANTVKGKGVSFMENQAGWHGKAPNTEQYEAAKAELASHYDTLKARG